MQAIAQMWLVLRLTGSGVALGVTTAPQFTPMLVAGAWGGVVADRVDKWALSEDALVRIMQAAGFSRLERGKQFELPATSSGSWKGPRGIVRGFV